MKEYTGSNLMNVNLSIGELSCIDADSLRFLLDVILEDKGLKGTDIHITVEPAVLACKKCGKHMPMDYFGEGCPECGHDLLELLGNRDVRVESLEIEDEN